MKHILILNELDQWVIMRHLGVSKLMKAKSVSHINFISHT